MSTVVVPTGTANTASVLAALKRLGQDPSLDATPDQVRDAERVVVPGVGTFAAALGTLSEGGYIESIRDRIRDGRPTLGICLGFQILAEESEESPGVRGLGILPVRVERFQGDGLLVPQLGWNQVEPQGTELIEPGYAYFAHSYRVVARPDGWAVATTVHGDAFVSAVERGPVLGCQFHPELSGDWGMALIERWLAC